MSSFTHVSDTELDIGLNYAKEHYSVSIDRDMLRTLCNATGSRQLEVRCNHYEARTFVLREHLSQRNQFAQNRFAAYSGAIGKIANRRKQFSSRPAKKPRKLSPVQRMKKYIRLGNDGCQYEFIC